MNDYIPENPPTSDAVAVWALEEFKRLQLIIEQLKERINELEN